ncbi:MAG: WD40/YVTN/BNR-like repeat-containing protein [Vicinamibacterales bacterium]
MAQMSREEAARRRNLEVEQVERLQKQRGLTTDAIASLGENTLRRQLLRLEYPNFARARQAFRLLQERDESGSVPAQALPRALSRLDAMRTRAVRDRVAGVPSGLRVDRQSLSRTAGLSPFHTGWVALGPGNVGGRTRAIVVHPTAPATIWAASVGGGVWRTDDSGGSWTPVDDLMANLAVCCMVMDPGDPQVIYAGTGEGFFNLDAIRGAGIFMTRDGDIWTQLTSTTGPQFTSINRLAISRDSRILLAATPAGLFRSDDAPRARWTLVLDEAIADVDFDPENPALAVAGSLSTGRAFFSTDGGATWRTATTDGSPGRRVEVTYAAQGTGIVYASVEASGGEIWLSTDGGQSYRKRAALSADGGDVNYLGDQGWYDNVIWAGDPTDASLVIVGGIDLWRSTDGGDTLVDISTWWSRASVHADHHAIVSHPAYDGSTNRQVFLGNDGGIYTTMDIRTAGNDPDVPRDSGWARLVNSYAVTQFYGGAGNSSGTIIGGAQDNGTLRYTPGTGHNGWAEMFGGDGGWCAADPGDPDVMYGEYVYLNIHRSTNGGVDADYISGQFWDGTAWRWKPVPYRISDARNSQALFIAPFVLDPNDSNRILGGGISLWRTSNAKAPNTSATGPSWAPIKPALDVPISAIAVADGNADLIWVGHAHRQGFMSSGDVYKTTNGTANAPAWSKVDDNQSALPPRYCTRITIDAADHQAVYVTFGGYSRDNVWKTSDGGATWTNIGSSLPEAPIRSLVIHPRRRSFLYIGTEVGVFASENGGASWSPTNEGPTTCSVDELFWMGETLVCATHGRGMFSIDLSRV